jgi:hypothetical protein
MRVIQQTHGGEKRYAEVRHPSGSRVRIDFSVFKNIRFSQRANFQIRVEAFNLLNKVQWPTPNTTVTNTAFGTVSQTQSNDPRFVQLAFRISY